MNDPAQENAIILRYLPARPALSFLVLTKLFPLRVFANYSAGCKGILLHYHTIKHGILVQNVKIIIIFLI